MANSKILMNQSRNGPSSRDQLSHHLVFTKNDEEPGCCRENSIPLPGRREGRNRGAVRYTGQTSSRLTLLVKSKTGGKAILYRMFEGPRDCLHAAGDPRSYGVGNLPLRLNQQSQDILYLFGELSRLANCFPAQMTATATRY